MTQSDRLRVQGSTVRPTLIIILSTGYSLEASANAGHFGRTRRLVQEYARSFNVVVFSCDAIDFSNELGVEHKPVPWLPKAFGWHHLVFWLWLLCNAGIMRGIVKVIGSNIPVLPLVKHLSGSPLAVTYEWDYARQTRMNEKRGIKYWLAPILERYALRSADLVLVTNMWLDDKVRTIYGKRTLLVPNWVDTSFVAGIPEESPAERVILYVGRLHWSKGVDVLIDAFARLESAFPRAKLVICGGGQEQSHLLSRAVSLGLSRVEFRGVVENSAVLRLMRSSTIFVLPTVTIEGHPRALLEAMACGAACVASDVPGNQDVIVDGHTGLLVPPSDVGSLAGALSRLLKNPELRNRLGQAAADEARGKYDFSKVVSKEIEVLKGLASGDTRKGQNSGAV